LAHFSTAGDLQITFKPKYKNSTPRTLRKSAYFTVYMGAFILAFTPLIVLNSGVLNGRDPWTITALSCIAFLPMAFFALREGVKIGRAEALVASQHKTIGPLVEVIARGRKANG
jgi:hypothetical protein